MNQDNKIENNQKEILFPEQNDILTRMHQNCCFENAITYAKVLDISEIIKQHNGRALLVGGCVRDMMLNKISKDFDIEVYNIEIDDLKEILTQQNIKINEVGRSYGILKAFVENGSDIDISLLRQDSKIDKGHKGFEVKTDSGMSIKEAARRRDFTINSITADPLTQEVFDYYEGVNDIQSRVLKIIDPLKFIEDPLRVLRGVQFIGRFGLTVDKQTMQVMQEIIPLLKELPKERIYKEWEKLLLKSEKPSLGLSLAMSLGIFKEIHPEIHSLICTQQSPKWHPEGDVWNHTLMVVDKASEIIQKEELSTEESLILLFSSLCHDFGKTETTKIVNNEIVSPKHEAAGEEPAKKFLTSLGVGGDLKEKIIKLVANHLQPTLLYTEEVIRGNKVSDGAIRKLAQRLYPATIQELVWLSQADQLGRGSIYPATQEEIMQSDDFPAGKWLLKRARDIDVEKSKPSHLIRGIDLIRLGYKQGKDIGELIKIIDLLRDEKQYTKEDVFKIIEPIKDSEQAINQLKKILK